MEEAWEEIKTHPKVASVRQLGVIFAMDLDVEMDRYGELRDKIFNHFIYSSHCI